MRIKPVLTEKGIAFAKKKVYTFWVPKNATKPQIKAAISNLFDVDVKTTKTMTYKPTQKRNVYGKVVRKGARKKAMVTLGKSQKIDVFREEGKTK